MKTKIVTFIMLIFIALQSFSQNQTVTELEKKLLSNLKQEITDIQLKKLPFKDIAFAPDGHWLIIFADFGYSYSYIGSALSNKLNELNKAETLISEVEIISDNKWIIITENDVYANNLANTFANALTKIKKSGKKVNSASYMSDDKWILLYGKNAFACSKNNNSKMLEKLKTINSKAGNITKATLTHNNGWLLQYGKQGYSFQSLPADATLSLKKIINNNQTINFISTFKDKWIIVYNSTEFECNF